MKLSILFLTLISFLNAEIVIVKATPRLRNTETKINFYNNKVTVKKEKESIFSAGHYIFATYTYEEYLTKSCNGRKYTIISANFGNEYYDSFVVNCLD
jgi:archaellum component FlaF (FlaF/FlaG flagellin family)